MRPDFQFSQSSLQDFHDCARRFELRYVQQQPWPAVEAEPLLDKENYLKQGALFHQIVHQHLLGFEVAPMIRPHHNPDLARWWEHFLQTGLDNLPPNRHPEKLLSIRLAAYPLVSRYDLIALGQNGAVIVDWKTAHHRPSRAWLEGRLQTRIYRYVLARAGAHLNNGKPLAPENITMRYWFANFPTQAENMPYSRAQMEADEAFLTQLIGQVAHREAFPLTSDEKNCRFCSYRTLCRRGEQPANFFESEDFSDPILELDF